MKKFISLTVAIIFLLAFVAACSQYIPFERYSPKQTTSSPWTSVPRDTHPPITEPPHTPEPREFPVIVAFGEYDMIIQISDDRFMIANGEMEDGVIDISSAEWGVIDANGNEIIEFGRFALPPITIDRINWGYIDFALHDGRFVVRESEDFVILSPDGDEIARFDGFTQLSHIVDDLFLVRVGGVHSPYWGSVLCGEIGLMNSAGDFIIPVGYVDDFRFSHHMNILTLRRGGEAVFAGTHHVGYAGADMAIMNIYGDIIIPFGLYDEIFTITSDLFHVRIGGEWCDEYVGWWRNEKHAVVDVAGNEIVPFMSNAWIRSDASNNYFLVEMTVDARNQFAVFDALGNEIVPFGRYDYIQSVDHGMFVVQHNAIYDYSQATNSPWAVVNSQGEYIIPFGRYNSIWHQSWVFNVMYGNWPNSCGRFIDMEGNYIIPPTGYSISQIQGSRNLVWLSRGTGDRTWSIVNINNQTIIPFGVYESFWWGPGNTTIMFRDTQRDEFGSRTGGYWRVIDAYGNDVVPRSRIDRIDSFHIRSSWQIGHTNNPVFRITLAGQYEIRCTEGHVLIPLGMFDDILSVNDGFAVVEQNGQIGLVDIR